MAHRLAADELDCRLLLDLDTPLARQTAQAGATALSLAARPGRDALLAGYRLAACGAGAALDVGKVDEGNGELDHIIGETGRDPFLAPANAMARLERGLHLSRGGELVAGQADLIAACSALESLDLSADVELCHWLLAEHYRRTEDFDEALRLIEPLLAGARSRHAVSDVSVYALGLAHLRALSKQPAEALAAFEESLEAAQRLNDAVGESYAEAGIGSALLQLGRDDASLPHARRAVQILPAGVDPVQSVLAATTYATILNHLHRPSQALAALDASVATMNALDRAPLRVEWLKQRTAALAQLGRWADAYLSLDQERRIDEHLDSERRSREAARLRAQYNRERDLASLDSLRRINQQGARLVRTQALAMALAALLLGALLIIAMRKVVQARALRRLALADELTGLPNRRATLQRLADQFGHLRRRGRPLSVLMIDLDRFKAVNDRHGHAAGDEALRHVAATLGTGLRAVDWVGRLGGEEFLAVLPDVGLDRAIVIAERIRGAVAGTPCPAPLAKVRLTVSIGVATADEDIADPQQLVARADARLFEAKRGGRDRVWSPASETAALGGAPA